MGKCLSCVHAVVYILTMLANLAGVALIISSLVSERWLIAEHSTGTNAREVHNHGLWKDCVETYDMVSTFRGAGPRQERFIDSSCTLKHYEPDEHEFGFGLGGRATHVHGPANEAHVMKQWNIVVMALLSSAGCFGLIAFLIGLGASVSFCAPQACCGKCSATFWFLNLLIAACLAVSGVIYFIYKAYDPEIRSEKLTAVNSRIEQQKGSSYTQAVAAAVVFILAFLLAIVVTALSCANSGQRHTATSKVAMMPYTISNTRV